MRISRKKFRAFFEIFVSRPYFGIRLHSNSREQFLAVEASRLIRENT